MSARDWTSLGNNPSTTDLLKQLVSNTYEIASAGGGAAVWGGITGTLSAQTDLQSALDLKANLAGAAFTGACTVTLESLALTPTAAFSLINSTAAAAGAQQVSPGFVWQGQGWKTDATAGSQAVAYKAHVLPVQGSANPSGEWHLEASINGGAFSQLISVTTGGTTTFGGSTVVSGGGSRTWAARGGIAFPASGVLQFFTNGFASNVDLVCAASATLQLGQDAAGVTNQMLTAANRITSDGVGAILRISGGNGRGGAGGDVIFSTYTTGGAGSPGVLTDRVLVDAATGLLCFSGKTVNDVGIKLDSVPAQLAVMDGSGSSLASINASFYAANGTGGATSGPYTTITSITVVGGIVTDLQGS